MKEKSPGSGVAKGVPAPGLDRGLGRHPLAADEAPQHGEVLLVLEAVIRLLGFERGGDPLEPRVVHQVQERGEPHVALPDVLVAVDAGAERALRVVDVEGAQALEADLALELVPGGVPALPGHQVVSRGESVLGVDAHAEPLGRLHALEDGELRRKLEERK